MELALDDDVELDANALERESISKDSCEMAVLTGRVIMRMRESVLDDDEASLVFSQLGMTEGGLCMQCSSAETRTVFLSLAYGEWHAERESLVAPIGMGRFDR